MDVNKLSRKEMSDLQSKRLRATIKHAYDNSALYRRKFKKAGITPSDIKDYDDLVKIPFSSKKDIVNNFKGAIADKKVSVYHTTSGTSGLPTVVGFTRNDVDVQVAIETRNLETVGVTEEDTVQNATPYGMFFAGIDLHEAIRNIGATVIPAGKLPTAKQQVGMVVMFSPTVIIGIPQYILKLSYAYEEIFGKDPRETQLKRAYVLGEPLTDSVRKRLEDRWDMEVRQGYGLSEVGSGAECEEKNGFHWCEDHALVEVIDPETGERVADGEEGELVYTTISRTGTLAIRFRSNDNSRIIDEECSCGRGTIRIATVKHRFDDLVKIRGTLTSPYTIDNMLFSHKSIRNYLCVVDKDEYGVTDQLKVYIESESKDMRLSFDLMDKLGGGVCFTPDIIKYVPLGSIPIIGRKEKRFVDLRKENPDNEIVKEFMSEMK
ncbi:MAG: AMP-binding protein [Halobacteriota archaeon]|nr:AMP-binding protein [Halobacteriota archaeon]